MSIIHSQLLERFAVGKARYNHGVVVDSDTRDFGTLTNSWIEMAREEILDAIIYIISDYIRCCEEPRVISDGDDNERILHYANHIECIKNPLHKLQILNLTNLLVSPLFFNN